MSVIKLVDIHNNNKHREIYVKSIPRCTHRKENDTLIVRKNKLSRIIYYCNFTI